MNRRPHRFHYRKIRAGILAVLLAGFIPAGSMAIAQETGKSRKTSKKVLELRETEITARLRDVLGALKLSETEVFGTVEKPKLGYAVPWKNPKPFITEEGQSKFRFLEDVYTPLDKDRYTHQIQSEIFRIESLITKEAK